MEKIFDKALIAMSGGVDSSVAAYLMNQKGFDCTGVTMKLIGDKTLTLSGESSCCTQKDIEDAKKVAEALRIPHYVFNFSENFKESVIDRFVSAYENGMTPNPCIECNRYLKFNLLFKKAFELDFRYVVTGHYAKTEFDAKSGRYILKKARDLSKDQSYVLYSLTQEQLKHAYFPLGDLEKNEVRSIAAENGFINAEKKESQDICFVRGCNYADFIEDYTGRKYPPGDFVDINGNILGKHKGIIRYTVGQRKKLGLVLAEPLYVCGINPSDNTVVLGKEEKLFKRELTANNINLISCDKIDGEIRLKAKIRYRQSEAPATVTQPEKDTLKIIFDEPQRAITKGQSVVLYDGDTIVGGGTIC